MIELTPEQQQALKEMNGKPVRFIDPSTKEVYVLMPGDRYERLTGHLLPSSHEPPPGLDPWFLRCMQAYWRDLPQLLQNKRLRGKWVAYKGEEQVVFGKTQTDVYQECFRRGLERGQFYVDKIEPHYMPPWGGGEAVTGLYEVTDDGDGTLPPDSV